MSKATYQSSDNTLREMPELPNFRELRKSAKLTLRKVEKDTGISNPYLSQLENGIVENPSYKIVRTLIALVIKKMLLV